jgi:hypothetical protein
VPNSGDPLAALIETELRPLARVLARLIATELRVLLIQPTEASQPNGDGPPCRSADDRRRLVVGPVAVADDARRKATCASGTKPKPK